MANPSSSEIVEQVRIHNDIVEVIGRYVPLKRAAGRFRALCPFHKEKTPSFTVNPDRQLYYCFGCHAAGDVFKFVMDYEKVDFPTALRMLADRAGITIPERAPRKPGEVDKDVLYRLHEQLAAFYHRTLMSHRSAKAARAYLEERAIDEATARDYVLGYAPDQPGTLLKWAEKKEFTPRELEAAGVLVKSDRAGEYYERFRNRLMFPIRNEMDKVIGFSGRLLGEGRGGKYVNSPDTPLFHKSRVLYGLDRARTAMVDSHAAILCEGQIDVIRCQTSGFPNAVSPQGTALTEEHGRLLKRYADEVILVFDSDTAGENAALRAAEVCIGTGLSVRLVALPHGSDPDSLIRAKGPESFKDLLASARSLVRFHVGVLSQREDFNTETGLLRATRAILETIRHAPGAIQRDQFVRQAAEGLGVSDTALREELQQLLRSGRRPSDDPVYRPPPPPDHPPHEVTLAELLVAHPELADLVAQYLPLRVLTDPDCRNIIESLLKQPEDEPCQLLSELQDAGPECHRLAAQIQMQARTINGEEFPPEKAAQEIILALRRKDLERQRDACRRKLNAADEKNRADLQAESANLTYLIKKLDSGWDHARRALEIRDQFT